MSDIGRVRLGKRQMVREASDRWDVLRVHVPAWRYNTLEFDGVCRATHRRGRVTRYYHTDVRIQWADGGVDIDTGGWDTLTTRDRIACVWRYKGALWYSQTPFRRTLSVDKTGRATTDIPADEAAPLQRVIAAEHAVRRAPQVGHQDEFLRWVSAHLRTRPKAKAEALGLRIDSDIHAGVASPLLRRLVKQAVMEGVNLP